jgi:hypothetical protein
MATTILSPANGGNVACNFKLDIFTDSPTISVSMEISCPNAGPQNNLPRSCKAKKKITRPITRAAADVRADTTLTVPHLPSTPGPLLSARRKHVFKYSCSSETA